MEIVSMIVTLVIMGLGAWLCTILYNKINPGQYLITEEDRRLEFDRELEELLKKA